MAQQFGQDAQSLAVAIPYAVATEIVILTTNFLQLPQQNGKGCGMAAILFTVGTNQTSARLRIRRNPTGDNTVVYDSGLIFTQVAGSIQTIVCGWADPIPDGRPVQYQATLTSAGTTAAGSIGVGSYIEAALLSG